MFLYKHYGAVLAAMNIEFRRSPQAEKIGAKLEFRISFVPIFKTALFGERPNVTNIIPCQQNLITIALSSRRDDET